MNARIPFAACPLCNHAGLKDRATGDCTRHPLYLPALPATINWKECLACGHIFTEGHFTAEAQAMVFRTAHSHQTLGEDLERQRQVSARIVDKILPYADHGTWLDIGFGNGSLLFTAQEYGFIPIGVDLRAQVVAALASLGIEAHCKDLTALSFDQPCSVISMADVLEHMPYPKDGLTAAARLLADDGALFISMPNTESMLWRLLDQNNVNPYWGELEHYHNFSRSRLYDLLRETGFEPVQYGISERYRACMEIVARKQKR